MAAKKEGKTAFKQKKAKTKAYTKKHAPHKIERNADGMVLFHDKQSDDYIYLTHDEEASLVYPHYKYSFGQPPTQIYLPNKVVLLRLMRACVAHESLTEDPKARKRWSNGSIQMFYDLKVSKDEYEDDTTPVVEIKDPPPDTKSGKKK